MGFTGFYIYNEEQRQHINLSPKAIQTIRNDMVIFNFDITKGNLSGFLNLIFRNFYEDSSVYFKKDLNYIEDIILENLADANIKDYHNIYNDIIHDMKESLVKKIPNYEKGFPFKLRLNNENMEILESIDNSIYYDEYGLGFYLKAIFEQYARLSILEREKIIFKNQFNLINQAIERNNQIDIVTRFGRKLRINPVVINIADNRLNHIFVGTVNENNKEKIEYIELRDIATVKIMRSRKIKIDETLKLNLLRRDLQTIAGNIRQRKKSIFKIKFSQNGLVMYLNETEDRPAGVIVTQKDERNNIFTFECYESDMFYFFKYGNMVEILEPISLKDKFAALYKAAYEKQIK